MSAFFSLGRRSFPGNFFDGSPSFFSFLFLCGKGAVFFNRNLPHVSMRGEGGNPTGVKKGFFSPNAFFDARLGAAEAVCIFPTKKYKVFLHVMTAEKNWATTNGFFFPVGGECSKSSCWAGAGGGITAMLTFPSPKKCQVEAIFLKRVSFGRFKPGLLLLLLRTRGI